MTVLSSSSIVYVNSLSLSESSLLITVLVITRSPVFRVLVKSAWLPSLSIVPVSPVLSVVKPSLSVWVTVYSMPVGRSATVAFSPSFRVIVATPSSNVTSPWVPLIVLSLSSIVNSKSTVLSAGSLLTTLLVITRSPVLRVFLNSAMPAVWPIVPVSPVFVTVKSSLGASVTVYPVPAGRYRMMAFSPPFSPNSALPAVNSTSP